MRRIVLLVAFLLGAAFFALLPTLTSPIVLQTDEIPRFLTGLLAAAVVGARWVWSPGS